MIIDTVAMKHNGATEEKSMDVLEDKTELIEGIDNGMSLSGLTAIEEHFSGPLPHPIILSQYKDVLPDAPERIMAMAEKQQEHRFGLENSVVKGDIKRANTGLILGFILFIMFGVGAIVLLALEKNTQGYALLATSLLGGIGNFIRVGMERTKEIREHRDSEGASNQNTSG